MREGPSSEVLAGAPGWGTTGGVWRDGTLLAESVPIVSGRLTAARSLRVPEWVEFTVPDLVDGVSWVPDSPDHPLARYGQTVSLVTTVRSAVSAQSWQTRLGRFKIHSHEHDDVAGLVTVTAFGMLTVPDEDAFTAPETPRAGGTFASEFRRLMSPGLPVSIDPGLVDRAVPLSMMYPDDRLGALYELAKAWPARVLVDQWGQVEVLPPLPDVPSPVLVFRDGEGGTVVSAPSSDTRAGQVNVLVATSSATDSAASEPIRAVESITAGPLAATDDGTGYGRVVAKWSSPLATTAAQLSAAARTILADRARGSVVRTVTCGPDPRVELDDPVAVTRDGVTSWGWVVAYELPLTVADGPMRVDVGVSS